MSRKKINENPEMTGINKLKNLGKQQDASLGGIQPQLLAKAMQQASQGKSVSGAYSQQLGLLLNVLRPIMNDSSALQRVLQISSQVKDKQQPQDTGMYNQPVESVDLTSLREDEAIQMFMTENAISMAILGQYLEPKDASLVQQAMHRMDQDEGIPSNLVPALKKYMQVVTDFLEMGGSGLAKLKSTAQSFLGKRIGKDGSEPEMKPEMEPEMEKESVDLGDLRKLAGLKEDLGYMAPEEKAEGSVTFRQSKNTDKGSITVDASADDMEELAKIMKLAGLELPTMQASADDEEPEQEELLLPQEEICDSCGSPADECECSGHDHEEEDDAPCGDDEPKGTPKMIMISPNMDKNAIFNSLKAKLQDKLSS